MRPVLVMSRPFSDRLLVTSRLSDRLLVMTGMEGFEPLTHGVAYFECGVNFMNAIKVLAPGESLSDAIIVAGGGPTARFVTP